MESLHEHLKQFSAVSVEVEKAVEALTLALRKYGPVVRSNFEELNQALKYLLPLKSFPTRYMLVGMHGWTLVFADSRESNAYVEAYAISRATNCNAIGIVGREQRRELQIFEQGTKLRHVESLLDSNSWYYREQGSLQPWENPAEYTKSSKRKRLSVETVEQYFENYTGFKIPSWSTAQFGKLVGLERSVREVREPIIRYETVWDI